MKCLISSILFIILTCKNSLQNGIQDYPGPRHNDNETFVNWWNEFQTFVQEASSDLDLSIYENENVTWARTSFVQPQIMLHDRFLYDRESNQWTVEKYLNDLTERYGGIDSVLIWQGYPNIGIDDRNQFEMLESLPGGIESLREMVNDFAKFGVRVLLPYLPWDQGTPRKPGQSDIVSLIDLIIRTNSSGMNGDTMNGVNGSWWEEGLLNDYPIAIEPEVMYDNYQYLSYDVMSWGYWTITGPISLNPIVPKVSTYKAMTNGKHLTHICERWAQTRTDGLQYAFFNGAGYESWENIWGMWNGFTPRDGSALKRTSTILRKFGNFFQGDSQWIPHIPVVLLPSRSKTFASEFRTDDQVIWLLVNRDKSNDELVELKLKCLNNPDPNPIQIWHDLYHGLELDGILCDADTQTATVNIFVEAGGYGAISLTMAEALDENIEEFLAKMSELTSTPLSEYSNVWKFLPQEVQDLEVDATKATKRATHTGNPKNQIIEVPGGEFFFMVKGNAIEGDEVPLAVDVQFPWEDSPRRYHNEVLQVSTIFVDKYPVTNSHYKYFLVASNYTPPISDQNWLRHWTGEGEDFFYPQGFENKPVVWVSHSDASAYCHFYGQRLPHSWEWQWFAQGTDERPWPWGYEDPDESRMPVFSNAPGVMPAPDDVDVHPMGASWAGIEDLVGNVYQWTDVFTDPHTSKAVLRGSPRWRPEVPAGTSWYQPKPERPLLEHNTYLLLSESMDRNGGIGFRCVSDQ